MKKSNRQTNRLSPELPVTECFPQTVEIRERDELKIVVHENEVL